MREWHFVELPMNLPPVAASRESAAILDHLSLRRSYETPLQGSSWSQLASEFWRCPLSMNCLPSPTLVKMSRRFQEKRREFVCPNSSALPHGQASIRFGRRIGADELGISNRLARIKNRSWVHGPNAGWHFVEALHEQSLSFSGISLCYLCLLL